MTLLSAAQVAAELFLPSARTVETWAARGHLQSYGGLFLLEDAVEVEAKLRRRPRRAALLALAGRDSGPQPGG